MEYIKPSKWGFRAQFPENQKIDISEGVLKVTDKLCVEMAEKYDDAVAAAIVSAARKAGASDVTVLNKKAIVEAMLKQTPMKPVFVDTRFRNHGRSVADGVSLSKCFRCPSCNSHIFHVFDSEHYCVHCGQLLDWED